MARDRGQVAPFAALLLVLAGVVALLLGDLGEAAVLRTRARTAADAAALAGAADGRAAAEAVADANGAALSSFTTDGAYTTVEVRVGEARATARAERIAAGSTGTGGGDREGLAPAMLAALARADELLGRPVPVVSGYRSAEEQAALWARRATNPYPVARPGHSMHEQGLAIDAPFSFVDRLVAVASAAGLCRPLPTSDPVHFELCPWNTRG